MGVQAIQAWELSGQMLRFVVPDQAAVFFDALLNNWKLRGVYPTTCNNHVVLCTGEERKTTRVFTQRREFSFLAGQERSVSSSNTCDTHTWQMYQFLMIAKYKRVVLWKKYLHCYVRPKILQRLGDFMSQTTLFGHFCWQRLPMIFQSNITWNLRKIGGALFWASFLASRAF